MPDTITLSEQRVRQLIRDELERVGIYANDQKGVAETRRNFVALDRIATHADALMDLVVQDEDERREAEEAARASALEQRERKAKRYEAFLEFCALLAQYGVAGALGYGVSWIVGHWRH